MLVGWRTTLAPLLWSSALLWGSTLGGCLTVTTVNIGSKTSLEKQLMGEFEPLTDEEALAASVRAAAAAPAVGNLQAEAVAARQQQLFNRDDLQALKKSGCVGEGMGALAIARECQGPPELIALRERLLRQENGNRTSILRWALAADPTLGSHDLPQVTAIYQRLLREQASHGDWLQEDDGSWRQHP